MRLPCAMRFYAVALCLSLIACASTPNRLAAWSGLPFGPYAVRVSVLRTNAAVGVVFQPGGEPGLAASIGRLTSELCDNVGDEREAVTQCFPYFADAMQTRFPAADMGVVLATRIASSFESPPRSGRYPLVVLMGSVDGRGVDLLALAEAIASHGYVVAVAGLSNAPQRPVIDDQLLARLRSAHGEFVQAVLTSPSVDARRQATGGWSIGGAPGILYAMNHPEVRAVFSLDDALTYAYGVKLIQDSDDYRPTDYRGGLFLVTAGLQNAVPKSDDLVTALVNSQRQGLVATTLAHGQFSDQYGSLLSLLAPDAERRAFQQAHAEVANAVITFLDAHTMRMPPRPIDQ